MIISYSFFQGNVLNVHKKRASSRWNTMEKKDQSINLGMHAEMLMCHEALILYSFSPPGEHGGKQISYSIINQYFEKA